MPLYMYQASYTSDAWKAHIQHPHNRIEQVRPMIEAQGGKILAAYYAFGEYDMVMILDENTLNYSIACRRRNQRLSPGGMDGAFCVCQQ